MLYRPEQLKQRWIRISPHIIDSILLISAVMLSIRLQQYPGVDSWLTAKVVALLLYIVLGSIALKRGRTKNIRIAALAGALLSVVYIILVALQHNAYPWL